MEELPDDLRDFLTETCVLGRLTGDLCDRLLGRRGSAGRLEELARRQIFTVEVDETDGSYRYHEVLRSHLDRALVERIGEDEARRRYARAGELLEGAAAPAEALVAYARAEDWDAVRRLLGGEGERLAGGSPAWLATLPPAIVRHEPWLELAAARQARAEGRWNDGLEAYARAEAGFGPSAIALVCHRERLALRAWLDPVAPAPADWTRLLRAGLVREPLAATREATDGDVPAAFVRGLLALAAGEIDTAREQLGVASGRPGLGPGLAAVALLGGGIAGLLGGEPSGAGEVERAVDAAERAGLPWLARIARSASRLAASGPTPADAAAAGACWS
jgi:ATP/maltotriose-dependent transcriptional regulator MalT